MMDDVIRNTIVYTQTGENILLIEENKISCWRSKDNSLVFEIQGRFVGISIDDSTIVLLSNGHVKCIKLSTGEELKQAGFQEKVYLNEQRSIVSTSPNSNRLIVKDVFAKLAPKQILLLGNMDFHPPVRAWNSPFVVVRTWSDEGFSELNRHICFDITNGVSIFEGPSIAGFEIQISYSKHTGSFAVHECHRIRVYEVSSGKAIYDIMNKEPSAYRDGKIIKEPCQIIDICLFPTSNNMLAIANENEIRVIRLDNALQLFQAWEAGYVLTRGHRSDPLKSFSFSEDGKKLAIITSKGKLRQVRVDIDPSIIAKIDKRMQKYRQRKGKIISSQDDQKKGGENGKHLVFRNETGEGIVTFEPWQVNTPEYFADNSKWYCHLLVAGERVFEYGSPCGTCGIVFRKVGSVTDRVSDEDAVKLLASLEKVPSDAVLRRLARVLEPSIYYPTIIAGNVLLVEPGSQDDYFATDVVRLFGYEPPGYEKPINPNTPYYRFGSDFELEKGILVTAVVMPLHEISHLNRERIEFWKRQHKAGIPLTAFAVSVYDRQEPQDFRIGADVNYDYDGQILFTICLLDGHHRIQAAAELGVPVRILSLLAENYLIYESIDNVFAVLDKYSYSPKKRR